jgi:hypothetical protein
MKPLLHYQNDDGTVVQIGPEHPEYEQLLGQYRANNPNAAPPPTVNRWECVKVGALSVMGSLGMFWWQYARMRDAHKFSAKVEFLAGLLALVGVFCLLLPLASDKQLSAEPGGAGKPRTILIVLIVIGVMGGGALVAYLFHQWALGRLGLE